MNQKKPRIGISGSGMSEDDRYEMAAAARLVNGLGGEAVMLNHDDPNTPKPDPASFDGIILLGNNFDIDPADYGQKPHSKTKVESKHYEGLDINGTLDTPVFAEGRRLRAAYEYKAIEAAKANRIPIFGICSGLHRINVKCGGKLIQHISGTNQWKGDKGAENASSTATPIEALVVKRSRLDTIANGINRKELGLKHAVNTFHHQAIDPTHIGKGLKVTATSKQFVQMNEGDELQPGEEETIVNGNRFRMATIIEALESDDPDWYVLAIQWHPEYLVDSPQPNPRDFSYRLFSGLIDAARQYQAKSPNPATHAVAYEGALFDYKKRAALGA